jgi:hypothetical protein
MATQVACTQCGRPAIAELMDHPLCVDHWCRMQQALDADHARRASALNYLAEKAEARVGVRGIFPRYEVPMPTIATGPTTFNNIRVEGSSVGVINTGELQRLDLALTQVRVGGDTASADVLKTLTQAVIDAPEIDGTAKNEALEHLSYLAQQATLPPEHRQRSVGRTVVTTLERLLHVAASVATVYATAKPVLDALFQ